MTDELIEDLRAEIANRQVIIIAGAGVAQAASGGRAESSWLGLLFSAVAWCEAYVPGVTPQWVESTKGLIQLRDASSLVTAAERVTEKLGGRRGGEYGRWLRYTVGELRVADPAVPLALAALDVPIATTNYDDLLESAAGRRTVTWRQAYQIERVLRGDSRAVIHLHGHWDDAENVVLGIRSYEEMLGNGAAQELQKAMASIRTLLFVGVGSGANDPNLLTLRQWLATTYESSEYRHYRLCVASEVGRLTEEHKGERIVPLSYGTDHRSLATFLDSLRPRARTRLREMNATVAPAQSTGVTGQASSVAARQHVQPPPIHIVEPLSQTRPDVCLLQVRPVGGQSDECSRNAAGAGGRVMVPIPAGKVALGSTGGVSVEVPGPFLVSAHLVTQREYTATGAPNPSRIVGDDLPVDNVSWRDAATFCNRISEQDGLEAVYTLARQGVTVDLRRSGYRLPTETEWEYCCRAGTAGDRYGPIQDVAWYCGNSDGKSHEVGTKAPNSFGLYDMLGNVWEWCNDWYSRDRPYGSLTGPHAGVERVLRGGSWRDLPDCVSAGFRYRLDPDAPDGPQGFRVVLHMLATSAEG